MSPWTAVAAVSLTAFGGVVLFTTVSGPSSRPTGSDLVRNILPADWEGFLAGRPSSSKVEDTPSGYTDVAKRLNDLMHRNTNKVYTGGKGVLVRMILDGYQDDTSKEVVPATFWVNDIFAPSQMYPQGNPMHPDATSNEDNWGMPVVAVVVGTGLGSFFPNFQHIQDDTWGYGVFYPSDSNSADSRCRYDESSDSWDCPGGTVWNNGQFQADGSKKGAGSYPAGNPRVTASNGGGAGCHFDKQKHFIDQINSKSGSPDNLVQNKHCECNYNFAHNFPKDGDHSSPVTQNGWDQWLSDFASLGLQGKAGPAWQMDLGSCWTNNVRDMINMQNRFYWMHRTWLDGSMPYYKDEEWSPVEDRRRYWGWNEVPVDRRLIGSPSSWDAVVIHLPAFACGPGSSGQPDNVGCLNDAQKGSIKWQLDQHVQRQALVPGLDHIAQRPGSYILFAREIPDKTGGWSREFFCQNLTLSGYQVVYNPPDQWDSTGKCYLDRA